ncbi:hypothetical protein B0O99DRAFT_66862 [Bisporella sp. PMI_857]|nr:hypothetical protein B0O99DRAFT_66862 [Bisporella sp. PMI_857]
MSGFRPYIFLFVATFVGADVVYITDLPAFSLLAPCAAYAVSYGVSSFAREGCPADVTAFESCVCTKDSNSAAISADISSSVLSSCGATASEDVASASAVLNNYCEQDKNLTPFPALTNSVTQYIEDLPAWSDLGPCAAYALSYVVKSMTYDKCPPAASAMVSCACLKNQNSLLISGEINKSVFSSCGTTHSADVSSAHAVFAGYCGLNNGTSSFPTPSPLKGDMTYYITDMAEYSSLAPCARSAIYYDALYSLTYSDCPSAPGMLASCACSKDGNFGSISTEIIKDVRSSCASTANADITSALAVLDLYCSAANGLVTPQGITNSVATTAYSNGGSNPTGTSGKTPATKAGSTGTSFASETSSSSSSGNNSDTTIVGRKLPMGAIIGGSVGAAIIIGLIIFGGWRYRRSRFNKPKPNPANQASDFPPDYNGKAELASTSVTPLPAKDFKPAPSPISPGVSPITQEKPSEMQAPPAPYHPVAPGTPNAPPPQQGYGYQQNYPQQPGPHATEMQAGWAGYGQAIEMHGQPQDPRYEMSGVSSNMNQGPYYEMPGQHQWSR